MREPRPIAMRSVLRAVLRPALPFAWGAMLLALGDAALAQGPTAQEVLSNFDKTRNPESSLRLVNTLTEYRNGQPRSTAVLGVYSKVDAGSGQFRNVAVYRAPARDAGKALLMDGKIMWFFDPRSNASVRISPQQRLIGQASNGDVLNVNLGRSYQVRQFDETEIRDADKVTRATWHLDLGARDDTAVYGRVEYWIERATYLPVMARMYSDSGKPLKKIYYRKPVSEGGQLHATEAVIVDELDPSLITKMVFSQRQQIVIPDALYQRDALPSLQHYESQQR